jgi:hypothetical protein
MNTFIIAMIVVVLNGAPQYWYNINEANSHSSMFSCQTQIADGTFQQQTLQNFNRLFRNKVAMVRLACLPGEKVEVYKTYMKERNDANVASMSSE